MNATQVAGFLAPLTANTFNLLDDCASNLGNKAYNGRPCYQDYWHTDNDCNLSSTHCTYMLFLYGVWRAGWPGWICLDGL